MAKGTGKKLSDFFVWILLGLLILALAGFGVSSFGSGGQTVGKVGDRSISAQDYFRALNTASREYSRATGSPGTFAELEAAGVLTAVRSQLAVAAALDNENDKIGLSVGDAIVSEQVTSQPAFRGLDGTFSREVYVEALDRVGYTVESFETQVREESARAILQGAVGGGTAVPPQYTELFVGYAAERRSYTFLTFARNPDDRLPEPTEDSLRAFYDANPDDFTLPEMKRITYAWLTPEMLMDEVEVDAESIAALYQERISEFVLPEQRLVEQLVFETAEEAVAAKTAIDNGETTFREVVEARGLTLSDIDLGAVTPQDLGAAGDAVFLLEGPALVGPYPTDLGPALFRMNAILAARETTLEEATPDLRQELAIARARRIVDGLIGEVDDLLAGGATLEELASETDMETGTLDFWAGSEEPVTAFEEFRDAAAAVTMDDFPEVIVSEDGSIFAMRLDEIVAPRVQDFDEVIDQATVGWQNAEIIAELRSKAEVAFQALGGGFALDPADPKAASADKVLRDEFVERAPQLLSLTAFEMDEGERRVIEANGAVYLIELTEVLGPDEEDPRIQQYREAFESQIGQVLTQDLVAAYSQALIASEGISFNDAALNGVHTQMFR